MPRNALTYLIDQGVKAIMHNVLLVEDDVDLRDALKARIEQLGHSTITAENGREALNMLSQADILPNLILTNWDMPIMGGKEFLEGLSKNEKWSAIRVFVVSGSPRENLPRGVECLSKPLKSEDLLNALKQSNQPIVP